MECGNVSNKTHYKANKRPVGLGRAVEIRANNERGQDFRKGREICIRKASGRSPRTQVDKYNVWIERKEHWNNRNKRG